MEMKQRIMGRVLAGHLEDAERLAHIWTRESGEELMSWLVLAEVQYLRKDFEGALGSLERARAIDSWHPMFFRIVCLAAHGAEQHTVSSVAFTLALFSGLPTEMMGLLCDLIEDEDPEESDPDPRWLALVEVEDEEEEDSIIPSFTTRYTGNTAFLEKQSKEDDCERDPTPEELAWRPPAGARISGGSDFGNEWPWGQKTSRDDET